MPETLFTLPKALEMLQLRLQLKYYKRIISIPAISHAGKLATKRLYNCADLHISS